MSIQARLGAFNFKDGRSIVILREYDCKIKASILQYGF